MRETGEGRPPPPIHRALRPRAECHHPTGPSEETMRPGDARVAWKQWAAPATLLVLAIMSSAECGGRPPAPAVRDVTISLPAISVHGVGDVVGRWESTAPGARTVWIVRDDGTVESTDGRTRGAGRITTQNGRVLFTPAGGATRVLTLYLLPDNRLLLGGSQGTRMVLTPLRP